jgi:signal transduction histidine kinase
MSNETMDSIFDPFFTTKKSGTGLGLSIVHGILESYGSRLEVKSRLDTGTTFTMRLRRAELPT